MPRPIYARRIVPIIAALNVYPVKSCRGIALERAQITETGFAHDREWLIVTAEGQFITQREEPRLALIETALSPDSLQLRVSGTEVLQVPYDADGEKVEVTCWKDRCAAIDAGNEAAAWISQFLGKAHRLVRFDRSRPRLSNREWTGAIEARNQFTDGFPWLVIARASLEDLNKRLPKPLPMNRFRPNIVLDGVAPYAEDETAEFEVNGARFRIVKPCARCAITTTDQQSGSRDGDEPLRTLKGYRFDTKLKGVLFGQNAILLAGEGRLLNVGDEVKLTSRRS
jgi:uncharacterized protein YcbX